MTAPLRCPQCGGENELPSGVRLIACAFCGAALFVDRSGLVSHYRLPRLLDREQAERALRRWMAGNETVKDLDQKAELVALEPVSFPVWMFRRRTPDGESVLAEPAAPTPEPKMADLDVPAGKLEPYRTAEEGVETIAATVPLETARGWLSGAVVAAGAGRRGAGGGKGAAGGAAGAPGGEVIENALVHLLLWRAAYRFGGQSWTALVEASTGRVLASVFPAKKEAPFFLVAGLGLVLFGVEGILIDDLVYKALAYLVTSVPLAMLAWWVTSRT